MNKNNNGKKAPLKLLSAVIGFSIFTTMSYTTSFADSPVDKPELLEKDIEITESELEEVAVKETEDVAELTEDSELVEETSEEELEVVSSAEEVEFDEKIEPIVEDTEVALKEEEDKIEDLKSIEAEKDEKAEESEDVKTEESEDDLEVEEEELEGAEESDEENLELEAFENVTTENVDEAIEAEILEEDTEVEDAEAIEKTDAKEEKMPENPNPILNMEKADGYYNIKYQDESTSRIYLYREDIIRYFKDPTEEYKDPVPSNSTTIVVSDKYRNKSDETLFNATDIKDEEDNYSLETDAIKVNLEKKTGLLSIFDKRSNMLAFQETEPIKIEKDGTTLTVSHDKDEHFYGGGTQNGRFAHKGEEIRVWNSNNWVDGGVASPTPYYWSTNGYGVLRHTYRQGWYRFNDNEDVTTKHSDQKLDSYIITNPDYYELIKGYHEITGLPALMPKYGFYPAHLNAYNRDYWVEVPQNTRGAILFEDGKYYREYQPANLVDKSTGTLETLNGDEDYTNYQFSARAVIDRYLNNDMPMGWILPNDGYGAGYGQTDSLEGDIENLRRFVEYANERGVDVGLWTQSAILPEDENNPKKNERDIKKEVGDAGVTALKTDVAWVGKGYSFGLNGTDIAASAMREYGGVRPFIISLDGWAGTQRNAGIWSGDQTGGKWEYIRFHIPTFTTTGLSGNPNITNDLDGIFGGLNKDVYIRDHQWKTFTPMYLSMDGWGSQPKYPFIMDKEATDINRAYLKLKTQMMPYNYSIAHDSTFDGKPMVRAMFLDHKNEKAAYTDVSKYQFMWGDSLLVAPVYEGKTDGEGNSLRDGIYLPEGNTYYNLFTGEALNGGQIVNNYKTELWNLPVFAKDGAIIPMIKPHNTPKDADYNERIINYYPSKTETSFTVKDDDGRTEGYLNGKVAKTDIRAQLTENNILNFNISATNGTFDEFNPNKTTRVNILSGSDVDKVIATVGGKEVVLRKAESLEDFNNNEDTFFYNTEYRYNEYLDEYGKEKLNQKFLMIKLGETNVAENDISLQIENFKQVEKPAVKTLNESLEKVAAENIRKPLTKETSIELTVDGDKFDSYDIEFDGNVYTNVLPSVAMNFRDLKANTAYPIRIRGVVGDQYSEWTELSDLKTAKDALSNAIKVVEYEMNKPSQPGEELEKLFDLDLKTLAHSQWGAAGQANFANGETIDIIARFDDVYAVDKMIYYPRENAGNGTWVLVDIAVSEDGENFSILKENHSFKNDSNYLDNTPKEISFGNSKAKAVKVVVKNSVGGWSSGNELAFIESQTAQVDKIQFMNYSGLKDSDNEYSGYMENYDINKDGLIDVIDIYHYFGDKKLSDDTKATINIGTSLVRTPDGKYIRPADNRATFEVNLNGATNVNGIGLKVGTDARNENKVEDVNYTDLVSKGENFSYNRAHNDGEKAQYIQFINTDINEDGKVADVVMNLDGVNLVSFTQVMVVATNGNPNPNDNKHFKLVNEDYKPEDDKLRYEAIRSIQHIKAMDNRLKDAFIDYINAVDTVEDVKFYVDYAISVFGEPDYSEPETPEPTDPETPDPEVPENPEPTDPETPDPEAPETPEPTDPETPDPEVPENPEPTDPETPDPEAPETPEPTDPETPDPEVPENPEPTDPETPDPEAPETPEPTDPETPDPEVSETPKPTDPETPDPEAPETPEPTDPETPDLEDSENPEEDFINNHRADIIKRLEALAKLTEAEKETFRNKIKASNNALDIIAMYNEAYNLNSSRIPAVEETTPITTVQPAGTTKTEYKFTVVYNANDKAEDIIYVHEGFKTIKEGFYKRSVLEQRRALLKEALVKNQAAVEKAQSLLQANPAKEIKEKLETLISSAKVLEQRAQLAIKELNIILD